MKTFIASALLLTSCAYTTLRYPNGAILMRTQADMRDVVLLLRRDGGIEFRAATLNHSTPTRAGGSVVGTAGSAAVGLATAISTYGQFR